jgi:hypothetical protein
VATVIPFAISNSSDDEHGAHLAFGSSRRRASGHAHLTEEGLRLQLDPPDGRSVVVPYEAIASVVFTPGLLRNRLRVTARRPDGFATIGARRPGELTTLVGRRHRDGAREFAAQLRLRVAEAAVRPVSR